MRLPRSAAAPLVIAAAVFAAYSGSLSAGFTGDARGLILEDARVRDASSENLANIIHHTYWWPYGESGLYRPVTTLSYLFNYSILGNEKSPAGYHWLNLLLHVLNALLLYTAARRFTTVAAAGWIAALWALHPVLTEPVAAIAGRADLIAGACVLGGLLLYWNAVEAAGVRRALLLAALALVTLTGVLAKESAVVLPVAAAIYAWLWRERRAVFGAFAAMLLPVQAMLLLRGDAMSAIPKVEFPFWDNPIVGADFFTARGTALGLLAREAGLLAWPARLSADYSWGQIRPEQIAWIGLPVALLLAAGLALAWKRSRLALFLAATALAAWLPSSNLLMPIGAIFAERFLYLPAIAFAAAVVWLALRVPRGQIVLAAIALAFAARTWVRTGDWSSDLTLAEATVRTAPESYKSHKMLAVALHESEGAGVRTLAEAERSLAILDPLPPLRNNADTWRRAALWYQSKSDAASLARAHDLLARCKTIVTAQAEHARSDPKATPENTPVLNAPAEVDRLMAQVEQQRGHAGEALGALTRSLESDPTNARAWLEYVNALAASGRMEEAVVTAEAATLLTMDNALRQRVVELYRASDQAACALNGNAINPACPPVHAHLCNAAAMAMDVRRKSGTPAQVEELRKMAVEQFGCGAAH